MWVYACPQFDETTMQCAGGQWVEIPDSGSVWIDMLPTLDEANSVGIAMFSSLMILTALVRILRPPREE